MQGSGFRLVVRRGPQPSQVYELAKDICTLGRDATNEVPINDAEVSRHHCRFTRVSGGYTIEDLGSTNGTFVNSQRLTAPRPLSSGDVIGLGETVTLVYEAAAMAPGPMGPGSARQPTFVAGAEAPPGGPPPPGDYYDYGGAQQQQPPDYGPPGAAPPPGVYADYPEEYSEAGMGRWIVLGCGVFMVLCIITTVIAIILIDQSCAWDNIPILSDIVDALGYQVNEAACN